MEAMTHIKLVHDHNDNSYRAETMDATHTLAVLHKQDVGWWHVFCPDRPNVRFGPYEDRNEALHKLHAVALCAYDRLIVEAEQMARAG